MSVIDYFQLFDLPRGFDIDDGALQPRYRELQRQFHPDRFAAEPVDVQRVAVQRAADINAGFSVLKDAVLRARHLLELAGHPLHIESATVSDTDFLMAQMELREAVEAAQVGDGGTAIAALDSIGADMRRLMRADYDILRGLIDDTQDSAAAVQLVRQLMFQEKLLADIDAAIDARVN